MLIENLVTEHYQLQGQKIIVLTQKKIIFHQKKVIRASVLWDMERHEIKLHASAVNGIYLQSTHS